MWTWFVAAVIWGAWSGLRSADKEKKREADQKAEREAAQFAKFWEGDE